nr:hypothetical protein [Rhizobium leguminosarum]
MESLSKNATKSKYFVRIFFSSAHSKNNLWVIAAAPFGAGAPALSIAHFAADECYPKSRPLQHLSERFLRNGDHRLGKNGNSSDILKANIVEAGIQQQRAQRVFRPELDMPNDEAQRCPIADKKPKIFNG